MHKDRQVLIGPFRQFMMYSSDNILGKRVYLFVPGFGQNGSGLCYLYSELYKKVRDSSSCIPFLFDYVNSGDSEFQAEKKHNSVQDYWEDCLIILDLIEKYKPKEINVILTGMSMFYIQNILHYQKSINIILVPPYPIISLNLGIHNSGSDFNTSDEFKVDSSIKNFFESLGASWSSWKGINISNTMAESLFLEASNFNKSQALTSAKIAFDVDEHSLLQCIRLYHQESMTIIHPEDRVRIMENL